MLEYLLLEDSTNVWNSESNIFGQYFAVTILDLSTKQIQPIVSKFAAIFLPSDERVNESFVLIIVKVLDCFDGKIAYEPDPCFAVNVDIFLNVDVNVI